MIVKRKKVHVLKDKHKDDYWLDVDGFLWFWSVDHAQWWYLSCAGIWDTEQGFFPSATIDTGDTWPNGPFTRVR